MESKFSVYSCCCCCCCRLRFCTETLDCAGCLGEADVTQRPPKTYPSAIRSDASTTDGLAINLGGWKNGFLCSALAMASGAATVQGLIEASSAKRCREAVMNPHHKHIRNCSGAINLAVCGGWYGFEKLTHLIEHMSAFLWCEGAIILFFIRQ